MSLNPEYLCIVCHLENTSVEIPIEHAPFLILFILDCSSITCTNAISLLYVLVVIEVMCRL